MDIMELAGVYSATFTPYDRVGRINPDALGRLIDFQARNGLHGLYVCGSTGEGPMLSDEERKLMAKEAVALARGRMKVIVHVGHICTDAAVDLARHAEECGADGVSSIHPIYYRYSDEMEYGHYRAIADAVSVPMLIYAHPILTGREMSAEHLLRLFEVSNIVGVKYTGMDFYSMRNISDQVGKPHIILSGADERMVQGLVFGTKGAIGTNQNLLPAPFAQMLDRFNAGDVGRVMELQQQVNRLIQFLCAKRDLSYNKAVMRYLGVDCGWAKRPFKQLTEAEYAEFATDLEQFDDLFAMSAVG